MSEETKDLKPPVGIDRTGDGANVATAPGRRVSFLRLTVLIEASKENGLVLDDIANYAESKMPVVVGAKLIKASQEWVASIETYGSLFPETPGAKRK